jgi:hypothetical protein
MSEWKPIESAPFEVDDASGGRWLDECLLLVRGLIVQGMCSGGQWIRRDLHDMMTWDDLPEAPTHWMPLPPPPSV